MPTPVFPSTLLDVSSFRLNPTLTANADSQPGSPRDHGVLSIQPGAVASVSWRFLETDYQLFRAFWTTELLNGHRWFLMNAPSAAGIVPHVVRFDGPYTARKIGHRAFEVSVDIEVRERQFPT